jgi:DNA polymerase-4
MYSKRKIIHIDMDAFYASVEQRDIPAYRGKPLIVGGNPQGRGVVAACSYEARRFGIHSAMSCARAIKLCPQALFTRPRIDRYREVSATVMDIFRHYTDMVEPLSLDEAFLDVTVNSRGQSSATIIAEAIRQEIFKKTGLTASAGVSFNKFLAKVASDCNKPNGITVVAPEQAKSFIAELPIGKFFGVGKVTEKKMQALGIHTGRDLRRWKREALIFHFGKAGTFLYNSARGADNRPVEPSRTRKSIGSETTLSRDTGDILEIQAILRSIADKLETVLAEKRTGGYTLSLKIRYHDFVTITRSVTLGYPIFSADDMECLLPGLMESTQAGARKVRLLGLSISKLTGDKRVPRPQRLPFIARGKPPGLTTLLKQK